MATGVEAATAWQSFGAGVECVDARRECAPDFELARRAAGGDMEAFERIYRLHHKRVYSLCLRMTANVAEAEDLAQEVFVHLFRTVGSFRGESAFTTWLHRMTVNQVLMHLRRKKRSRTDAIEDGDAHRLASSLSSGAGSPPSADAVALDNAVAKLPPGYRAVFILHDVEGYEHEEIARILGCAAGTSKSQLHKARMKLRALLKRRSFATPQREPDSL